MESEGGMNTDNLYGRIVYEMRLYKGGGHYEVLGIYPTLGYFRAAKKRAKTDMVLMGDPKRKWIIMCFPTAIGIDQW